MSFWQNIRLPGERKWIGFVLVFLLLLCSGAAKAVCTTQPGMRDDVLIVVNANSPRSPEIGDYYCEQRGINPAHIASVYLPTVNDVQLDQFVSLRDQLIRFLQLNTLAGNEAPVVCDTAQGYSKYYCPDSVDQIRRLTRIRYLVLARGIPSRFTYTGSTLADTAMTSVDNYLRFWLLNYFPVDREFYSFNQRAIDFKDGRGMRAVLPSTDLEFIVGRIDGITPENAKQLVDRALAAERNGVYGKLAGSTYTNNIRLSNSDGAYWKQWLPNGGGTTVYPSWHYLHGLFGELQLPSGLAIRHVSNPQCINDTGNFIELPQECVARMIGPANANKGPGHPAGAIPRPDQTLVYHGKLNGFSSHVDFQSVLNWRDTDSCNTLCDPDDAVCKAASVDVYQEIDTRCVRVADGFIGYNLGSYPVGQMYGSPTGWAVNANSNTNKWQKSSTSNDSYRAPEVRDDMGFDDSYSLWFDSPEQLPGATCYTNSDDLQQPPVADCDSADRVTVSQKVFIAERAIDLATPPVITVRFKYRALALDRNVGLSVRLTVHESVYSDATVTISDTNQIAYPWKRAADLSAPDTPADAVSWGDAVASFTLDPALHQHPQQLFDGLKVFIYANPRFEGQLAIDMVSLDIDGVTVPLQNASFSEGFHQLTGGDSAATFLGRLNGTAFWANLTHHGYSAGRSFDTHPYETLIYFLRGLPLGDAVWFAETNTSGIFYGDPLYSPIAVHLHYLSGSVSGALDDFFDTAVDSPLALTGDTLNGTGAGVTTTYSVDYCSGDDFFPCDQNNSWLPVTGLQNQPGGQRNMPLGNWDISSLAGGDYVLRLAVTSVNSSSSRSQTFYDYYPVKLSAPLSDYDNDGVSDAQDVFPFDATESADLDGDGLGDNADLDDYNDNVAPVLVVPVDLDIGSTGPTTPVDLGMATATDYKDGDIIAYVDNPGPYNLGEHILTWTAVDYSGNSVSGTQILNVYPVFNIAPTASILLEQNGVPITTIAADGGVVQASLSVIDLNPNDIHTYKWGLNGYTKNNTYYIDPKGLANGIYEINASVKDSGDPALSVDVSALVNVITEGPGDTSSSGGILNPASLLSLFMYLIASRASHQRNNKKVV